MEQPCKYIYSIGSQNKIYGDKKGVCRITGLESEGILFNDWIGDTFTDHTYLKPGNIISNEALFCFDEASEIIKQKTGKEKLQRFRTYSHLVLNGEWYCLTKSDKRKIFELIINGAELVCLTDTGQKHLLFKHKTGMWQLDETFIKPDIDLLKYLHSKMCGLLDLGFSQTEIITGNYIQGRVFKIGINKWYDLDSKIKQHRGSKILDFAGWMLFTDREYKEEKKIQKEEKGQLNLF